MNLKERDDNPNYSSLMFKYGLKDLTEWECYELTDNPGFFVIPNPFLSGYQRFLVKKCLSEYHNLPNKTNLDLHTKRNGNLWSEALRFGKHWGCLIFCKEKENYEKKFFFSFLGKEEVQQ